MNPIINCTLVSIILVGLITQQLYCVHESKSFWWKLTKYQTSNLSCIQDKEKELIIQT